MEQKKLTDKYDEKHRKKEDLVHKNFIATVQRYIELEACYNTKQVRPRRRKLKNLPTTRMMSYYEMP